MKLNSKIIIMLFITFLVISSNTLFAKSPDLTPSQINKISNYAGKLNDIHKNIYTLSQNLMFSSSSSSLTTNAISGIRKQLSTLTNELFDALSDYEDNNYLYRDILILQNASNYMHASLVELDTFSQQTSSSDKSSTIERFYYFRLRARQALDLFSTILT